MRPSSRFLAVTLLLCAAALLHAAPDPVKELATLEEAYETVPATKESMKEFHPRYEAFARANPGTEQALTAKLRLLEFTEALDNEARVTTAAKLFDEIIAAYPSSQQLARIPEMLDLFGRDKLKEVIRALSRPDKPDHVKASLLLADATYLLADEQVAKAEALLDQIIVRYGDLPYRWSTYGAVADAMLNPHSASSLSPGVPAPELEGKDVDGRTIRLSELKGRVVVVRFFGDWSDTCRATYPHERSLLEELKTDLKKQRFTFLGVNSDSSPTRARAVFAREKITWPVIFDNGSRKGPVAKKWRVTRWPTLYVIDAKGAIRYKNLSDDKLSNAVKELLLEARKK